MSAQSLGTKILGLPVFVNNELEDTCKVMDYGLKKVLVVNLKKVKSLSVSEQNNLFKNICDVSVTQNQLAYPKGLEVII